MSERPFDPRLPMHPQHIEQLRQSELRVPRDEHDQPLPTPNDNPRVHDLVIEDIRARKELGIRRYGVALQAHNGRDALLDLYQELLDATTYLRQLLEERAAGTACVGPTADKGLCSCYTAGYLDADNGEPYPGDE